MTNLEDIRDYIQNNLTRVLALALIVMSSIGVAMYAATNVLPAWKAHNDLAAQVASAQDSLQQVQDANQSSSDALSNQVATMQARVSQVSTVFLSEKEAAQVLANLYGYAKASGAQVTDLQAQPTPKDTTAKAGATPQALPPYTIRVFRVTVVGQPEQLLGFLTGFREAALPGVTLSNLKLSATDTKSGAKGSATNGSTTLVVDVMMYTSPLAPGNTLASQSSVDSLPLPLPGFATPTDEPPTVTPTPETAQPTAGPSTTPGAKGTTLAASTATATPTLAAPTAAPATATPGTTADASSMTATQGPPTATLEASQAVALQSLMSQLDKEWAAENWPAIITLSQQILQIAPETPGLSVKLYSAHTNYGYQLASQGRTNEAKAEFNAALAINPDGAAAVAGLKMLASNATPPSPAVKIYVVQWGDTLTALASHFNTTIAAIKAANHMLDDRIYAGQELVIPG